MTWSSAIRKSSRGAINTLPIAYPFVVWAFARAERPSLALIAAVVAIAAHLRWRSRSVLIAQLMLLGALGTIVVALAPGNLPRLYPVLVAVSVLQVFLAPSDRPALERMTSVFRPNLSVEERWWLGKITPLWIFFLSANTLVLITLLFVGTTSVWAFYSGVLFYVLLFAGITASVAIGHIVIGRRRSPGRIAFLARITAGFVPFGLSCVVFIALLPSLWILCGGNRRRFHRGTRWIIRVTFRLIFRWLRVIGFLDLEVMDQSGLPRGAAETGPLLIANHLSIFDIITTLAVFPDCSTLVKSKFLANPLLAPIIRAAGFIIARPNTPGTSVSLRVLDELRAGRRVIIFPEGTRSATGRLGLFDSGAFHLARTAGVSWTPVFFTTNHAIYNAVDKWATIPGRTHFRCVILPTVPAYPSDHDATPSGSSSDQRALARDDALAARALFERLCEGPLALEWNRVRPGITFRGYRVDIVERAEHHATLRTRVDHAHPLFDGHFPGYPVFPAVGQVELVERCVTEALEWGTRVRSISRAKFTAILKPGRSLTLELRRGSRGGERFVDWVLRDDQTTYSRGSVGYE